MLINIEGSGRYLPEGLKTSEEIDAKLGKRKGYTVEKTGIEKRYFNYKETASEQAKHAIDKALEMAGIAFHEIDMIIAASGTPEQIIPCNAALIAQQYSKSKRRIPCFDINATCMSFVCAFEMASTLLMTGRYQRILVVSSEAGDGALNEGHFESYALIGNAAAAFILTTPAVNDRNLYYLRAARTQMYPEYANAAEIKAGGSAKYLAEKNHKDEYYFNMQGPLLVKAMIKHMPTFLKTFLKEVEVEKADITYIVPHQASGPGISVLSKFLKLSSDRVINIIKDHGNTIAASIPFALDYALEEKAIKSGDKILLLGTGAGVSIGAALLEKV